MIRICSSAWLICRGWRTVWLDFWVLSFTLIGDLSDVTTVSVNRVSNLLKPSVGQRHVVRTGGGVSVSGFISSKVVACVIVFDGVGVSVFGGLIGVWRGCSSIWGGWAIRAGKAERNKGETEEGLKNYYLLINLLNYYKVRDKGCPEKKSCGFPALFFLGQ